MFISKEELKNVWDKIGKLDYVTYITFTSRINSLELDVKQLKSDNEQFKFFINELGYEVTPHKKQWKLTKKEK
jgi:hypothetical protein